VEKKLAHQLRDVTEATSRLYGNDLQIAERLLSRLLAFETQQTGFGLTATQDAHFNEVRAERTSGKVSGTLHQSRSGRFLPWFRSNQSVCAKVEPGRF
jgi:hypothetical protein